MPVKVVVLRFCLRPAYRSLAFACLKWELANWKKLVTAEGLIHDISIVAEAKKNRRGPQGRAGAYLP
jgi:hypothetical protein